MKSRSYGPATTCGGGISHPADAVGRGIRGQWNSVSIGPAHRIGTVPNAGGYNTCTGNAWQPHARMSYNSFSREMYGWRYNVNRDSSNIIQSAAQENHQEQVS